MEQIQLKTNKEGVIVTQGGPFERRFSSLGNLKHELGKAGINPHNHTEAFAQLVETGATTLLVPEGKSGMFYS
jgi:hypothetical protein